MNMSSKADTITPAAMYPGVAIFDFDGTVIEENSDTFIFSLLDTSGSLQSLQEKLRKKHSVWTDHMVIYDTLACCQRSEPVYLFSSSES